MSARAITDNIVLDADTPWRELPSLMLPAYAETWIMVGVVMLFVITIGGAAGVTLFNSSPRGLFPHRKLNATLGWLVNVGRSLPFLVLMAAIIPFTRLVTGTTIGIRTGTARRAIERVSLGQVLRPALVVASREPVASVLSRLATAAGGPPATVVIAPDGRPMGLVDLDAARGIDPARQHQVPVEAVTGRQPDGWVVVVPSRDAGIADVVGAVTAGGAVPPTMLALTPQGEVLGTITLADLNAAFAR